VQKRNSDTGNKSAVLAGVAALADLYGFGCTGGRF